MTAMAERYTGSGERFTAIGFSGSNTGLRTSFIHNHLSGTHKLSNWPVLKYPKSQQDEEAVLQDINKIFN